MLRLQTVFLSCYQNVIVARAPVRPPLMNGENQEILFTSHLIPFLSCTDFTSDFLTLNVHRLHFFLAVAYSEVFLLVKSQSQVYCPSP